MARPRCACTDPSTCHDPEAHEPKRTCPECDSPALFGEPTCGAVECIEAFTGEAYAPDRREEE